MSDDENGHINNQDLNTELNDSDDQERQPIKFYSITFVVDSRSETPTTNGLSVLGWVNSGLGTEFGTESVLVPVSTGLSTGSVLGRVCTGLGTGLDWPGWVIGEALDKRWSIVLFWPTIRFEYLRTESF